MKNHGKKMFPGTNASNIFFLDNQKNIKIDPNKYINKANNNKEKNDLNNKINKEISSNKNINGIKMPIKKRVLKKYNSTTLKKRDLIPLSNKNDNFKKRQLITHRSVDNLQIKKNPMKESLTEPGFNDINISNNLKNSNLNKIQVKHRILGSNRLNISINSKTSNKISGNTNQRKSIQTERNMNVQSKNFLNKFVNKTNILNKKNNINKNNTLLKSNEKKKYKVPKEEIFLIKKEKMDNNIIDINSLKKNLLGNGVNIVSLTGISSSLVPINNDSVKLIVNSNDLDKSKLNKIERMLKTKGLKLDELKNNYNKKYCKGLFPAKSKWNDDKYGGRENSEKLQMSMEFKKKEKENKFHKKYVISKQQFIDVTYKNNHIKRNKSME